MFVQRCRTWRRLNWRVIQLSFKITQDLLESKVPLKDQTSASRLPVVRSHPLFQGLLPHHRVRWPPILCSVKATLGRLPESHFPLSVSASLYLCICCKWICVWDLWDRWDAIQPRGFLQYFILYSQFLWVTVCFVLFCMCSKIII